MIIVAENEDIRVTHPDKPLFREPTVTKRDVVEYFVRIAAYMVPHVRDRPCTLRRFPDGVESGGFFQKNISDYFPDWLNSVSLPKEEGSVQHLLCNDSKSLAYVASQACIELHVSLSRIGRIRYPDRLVFDLDPPPHQEAEEALSGPGSAPSSRTVGAARSAAQKVRAMLEAMSLKCFLMTTGSAGYHVVVPLETVHTFDQTREFARRYAEQLVNEYPNELTTEMRKGARGPRVFVDYVRNAYGQTTIAPYSLRSRVGAPVATPIDWTELSRTDPDRYHIGNIFRRLGQRPDPWEYIDDDAQRLPGH